MDLRFKKWIDDNTDFSIRDMIEVIGIIGKAIWDAAVALTVIDFVTRNL